MAGAWGGAFPTRPMAIGQFVKYNPFFFRGVEAKHSQHPRGSPVSHMTAQHELNGGRANPRDGRSAILPLWAARPVGGPLRPKLGSFCRQRAPHTTPHDGPISPELSR